MWALVLGRGGFEPPKALGQLIYSQSRLTASVSARPRDFTDNRAMGKLRWILCQGLIAPSTERFIAGASNPRFEFSRTDPAGPRGSPLRRPLSDRDRRALAYPERRSRARGWRSTARCADCRREWPLDARWSTSAGAWRLHRRRPRVVAVDQYAPNPAAGACAARDEIRRRGLGAFSLAGGAAAGAKLRAAP